MKQCRSCGADIIWVETVNGKRMPVDAKPEKRFVLSVADGEASIATIKDTYVSHFATCPNASKHRKTYRKGDPAPTP